MPLFVPILRLLMLFLNVYESYKTLKIPPSSSRNGGRPSVRALSQRKRDIKGCLAVWLVWVSLTIYERVLESIVCLFIPFYDEFKSLALLFLILTRARGAEPIYLHLIRPMIKPYTKSLDAALEIMLGLGDFIFAISTYPIRLLLEWWNQRVGSRYRLFETEQDFSSDSSDDISVSGVPSSFLASSGPGREHGEASNGARLPHKYSKEKVSLERENRRPSASRNGSRSKVQELSDSRSVESNFLKPLSDRRQEGSSRHEIWYPPEASYVEEGLDDGQGDLTIKPSTASNQPNEAKLEATPTPAPLQIDEWREYPAFPSAYPPTPITTTSKLVPTSTAAPSSLYPAIEEETTQQDFHKSLLPPREPLNPSRAGDLSDKHITFGISSFHTNDDINDSMSTDGYEDEEEDDFNTTLRTPLHPQGYSRLKPHPRLFVSPPSISSNASILSRSSVLTTADNGSPLRTDPSSDSSLPAPRSSMVSSSVIGKKRSYPRSKPMSVKNKIRQIEDTGSVEDDSSDFQSRDSTPPTKERGATRVKSTPDSLMLTSPSDTADDPAETVTSSSAADEDEQERERIPPEEKRRKVVRSPPRAVHPSRPIRTRVSRQATSPRTQVLKGKLLEVPPVAKRGSVRLRNAVGVRQPKDIAIPLSASSSVSTSDRDPPAVAGTSKVRTAPRRR